MPKELNTPDLSAIKRAAAQYEKGLGQQAKVALLFAYNAFMASMAKPGPEYDRLELWRALDLTDPHNPTRAIQDGTAEPSEIIIAGMLVSKHDYYDVISANYDCIRPDARFSGLRLSTDPNAEAADSSGNFLGNPSLRLYAFASVTSPRSKRLSPQGIVTVEVVHQGAPNGETVEFNVSNLAACALRIG